MENKGNVDLKSSTLQPRAETTLCKTIEPNVFGEQASCETPISCGSLFKTDPGFLGQS